MVLSEVDTVTFDEVVLRATTPTVVVFGANW